MNEYTHIAIDRLDSGAQKLRLKLQVMGLLTAEAAAMSSGMAEGSKKLQHHLHVFLWDETPTGLRRAQDLINTYTSQNIVFAVIRVRWPALTEPGFLLTGTLAGDNASGTEPPGGRSDNGAWAYKGNIPSKFCFIEGLHTVDRPGYDSWFRGNGW
jgi:hypothetical protein